MCYRSRCQWILRYGGSRKFVPNRGKSIRTLFDCSFSVYIYSAVSFIKLMLRKIPFTSALIRNEWLPESVDTN